MADMERDLAEVLRAAARASGLSAARLAREAGVPQPRLCDFLNGKDVRLKTAAKLARRLGLELKPR